MKKLSKKTRFFYIASMYFAMASKVFSEIQFKQDACGLLYDNTEDIQKFDCFSNRAKKFTELFNEL